MSDFRNHTFDEIGVGTSDAISRTMSASEVEGLSLVAGQVDPYHLEGKRGNGPTAPGSAGIALVSNLILRRLPGPGAAIIDTQFHYRGDIAVGDTLTANIVARSKDAQSHTIEFGCTCVNQRGETLVSGTAIVATPIEQATYSNVATPELILRRNDGFARILERCEELPPVTCVVVHPCDRESLLGAVEAAKRDLIKPILVGPIPKLKAVAEANGVDLSLYQVVPAAHSHAAAAAAVAIVRSGEAESLMKGSLHTDELMGEVVASATGLRTARRVSQVFVMDVPTYPRLLLVTDAAINIYPTLEDKADIVQNAIELAQVLGIETPKVAILSAVETVNPKIESTLHAAALCKMADRGQITGGLLDGPLAFDNAVSERAARTKGIVSKVAGQADILLVPDLEAGNMVAKQLQYLAGADAAGIVLGTRVPIVLTSRADTVRTRLASTAVLKLLAHSRRPLGPQGAIAV